MALYALTIGYLFSLIGFLPGILFALGLKEKNKKIMALLLGFTSGLLMAFICFGVLGESLTMGGLHWGILGIILGVCFAVYLENRVTFPKIDRNTRIGFLLLTGILLHNLLEGVALGAMLAVSPGNGLRLALAISLHTFPEAVACGIVLKKQYTPLQLFLWAVICPLSLGIGAFLGSMAYTYAALFMPVLLSFAGGVILYVACGEALPDNKKTYQKKLSHIGAILGFLAGIVFTV